MKPATKVMLVSAAAIAAVFGGLWGVGEYQLYKFDPKPIAPGNVTLIAMNPDLGFAIRVSNSVAQLIQVDKAGAGFGSDDRQSSTEDARRIPMKELLQSLQGDEEALVRLVAVLNKIDLDDLQPGVNEWAADDIQKALDGDPTLVAKLEKDLNIKLDGTPLNEVRYDNITSGIRIYVPIPIQVSIAGQPKTLTAKLPINFQPNFAKEVSNIIEKRFNPSNEFIVGNYRDVAQKYLDGTASKEDIRSKLKKLIAEDMKMQMAEKPEQVLQGADVLVNESLLENATTSVRKDEKGNDIYTIHLNMTEEGRKRLWKYSRNRKGSSLLVVVNGVAIAAPKITTELAGKQLDLTDLREKRLVDDAVNEINALKNSQ
jgi:cytochrome c551/c552